MQTLKQLMPDLLLIAGGICVSVGASMVYAPAGYIVAGVLLIITGLRLARIA